MDMEGMEEILQDFLVEAGEILGQLDEQLVQLEHRGDDRELLNTIFRGFHTIKGGAGFLNLDPLVEVCHRAENVFNLLRLGQSKLSASMMDIVLEAYDQVKLMMDTVASGQTPPAPPPDLLSRLDFISDPKNNLDNSAPAVVAAPVAPTPVVAEATPIAAPASDDISEDEFEALLDALSEDKSGETAAPAAVSAAASSDAISEAEFDAYLDKLAQEKAKAAPVVEPVAVAAVSVVTAMPTVVATVVDEHKPESAALNKEETTIRVDTKRLDEVMNLVGELVLVRNRIMTLDASKLEGMESAVAHLELVTSSLQSAVMKTRMQPIKKVFGRFPRLVRDLARNLGKEVDLVLEGEDTDLDKTLVEELADPLVHLVRNAIDHGLEKPAERLAAGKVAMGRVVLSAAQEGDHILVCISDDGHGMDPSVLKRKAVEKGVLDEDAAARMDDRQAFNLIFAPGFSTKDQISDVSGRGVGMDVVKTNITRLNGTIDIQSKMGQGTTFTVRLPLTLAIIPTLMVGTHNQTFALPLGLVREIFHFEDTQTRMVNGHEVALVRDEVLPLAYLSDWLQLGRAQIEDVEKLYVVVVVIAEQRVGLVVDALYGQEEVVIKSLGSRLQHIKGFAGATITGNGRVVLILDVPTLVSAHAH